MPVPPANRKTAEKEYSGLIREAVARKLAENRKGFRLSKELKLILAITTSGMTVVFSAGKVFGYIDWNWAMVLSPLWLPGVSFMGLALFGYLLAALVLGVVKITKKLFKNSK